MQIENQQSVWNSEPFPVAILAGGLATRLRPITEKIPKALVEVAGKPFLEHQLELLKQNGIQKVVLCVGYLGEMIEREYGDGSSLGIHITYSYDGPKLLGTAGALRHALPCLGKVFFVLYGDSYLPIDFRTVASRFESAKKPALMTVYANNGRFDSSNVHFENGEILVYDKKNPTPQMKHIDYGLSILTSGVMADVPEEVAVDLADLFLELVRKKRMAACEVFERFYEIGSPAGLAELDLHLRGRLKELKGTL